MIGEIVSDNPHQSLFDWVRGRFSCPNCGGTIKKLSAAGLFPKGFSARNEPINNLVAVPFIRASIFLEDCVFSDSLEIETMGGQTVKVYFRCPHCGYYEIIWKKYGRLVQGPIFYRGVNVASVDRATMTVGERFLERKFRDWISESRRNGKRVLEAAVSGSSLHVYYYPSTNTVEEEEENKERYRLLEVSKEDFLRAFVGMKSKPGFFDLVERGWFSTDGEVRERISSFNRTLKREFAQSAACRGNGQVDDRIVNFLETINSDSVHAADLKQDQMADLADDLCRALFPPPRLMLLSWELGEEFTRRLKSQGANLLVGERLRLEEKGLSGYPGDSGGFKE